MNDEPELLDIVPWNYGFAHSWALRWLITNPESRTPVMRLLTGDDHGPWELVEPVACEHRVEGARADLGVLAAEREGAPVRLAVEVKVADPINVAQLDAYRRGGFNPVLFVPGLSGMLYAPNGAVAAERWVTGAELAYALNGTPLPPIISSYIQAVRAEAQRMDLARAFSREEVHDFPHEGQARYDDLMNAAWIVEVALAMRALGAEEILIRPQPNDRGLYWRGCRRTVAGAELYVDVLADLRTHYCTVALKVMGGDQAARLAAYETAQQFGPPSDAGWTCGRRPSRNSGRVWTLNASELNAAETAALTLEAGAFITRVAETTATQGLNPGRGFDGVAGAALTSRRRPPPAAHHACW